MYNSENVKYLTKKAIAKDKLDKENKKEENKKFLRVIYGRE